MSAAVAYWAPLAWIDGQWQRRVLMEADGQGRWLAFTPEVEAPAQAQRLQGPVLPSLVDAHSHAFQRAFAGLAERRDSASDDFWSWRDRMYGCALRVTPEQLRAIAAQLYLELLRGGYTQVCEFHYLQHQPDGAAYPDELAMSWALADAAADAGLGLTMLPVLYAHAGFTQIGLREDQSRFATDAAWIWRASCALNAAGRPLLNAGVALHSLRAAHAEDIRELQALVGDASVPIHIHISEQQQEVRDCLAATGQRPMQWLCNAFAPDARWQLVHATHSTPEEIAAVAAAGAGVVICPGTEGNLGDGLCDLRGWLEAGVSVSLGSDSHVTRGWVEELRWLEYGQRLGLQQRNVAAAPGREPSTAARLFEASRAGSAAPAGFASWGLTTGARADFLVLDTQHSGLLGMPASHLLDALVFASQGEAISDVFVAGRQVLAGGRHLDQDRINGDFAQAMKDLWGE
ncbi:formimidoylglutamate deiminase [Roseateles toxinivorans]|uniref:Formimidoylglutamate deiminase n=1 Tax=Roseateles toxinivorans TaxID=270368 RepID=A0A4R6QJW0_9BURK|nr:formimidoylglutamate deiminase [Roseateles toxinivorans]TDP63306.1 formimidoylglutamate deiminase [Roseateles toxinivorans]